MILLEFAPNEEGKYFPKRFFATECPSLKMPCHWGRTDQMMLFALVDAYLQRAFSDAPTIREIFDGERLYHKNRLPFENTFEDIYARFIASVLNNWSRGLQDGFCKDKTSGSYAGKKWRLELNSLAAVLEGVVTSLGGHDPNSLSGARPWGKFEVARKGQYKSLERSIFVPFLTVARAACSHPPRIKVVKLLEEQQLKSYNARCKMVEEWIKGEEFYSKDLNPDWQKKWRTGCQNTMAHAILFFTAQACQRLSTEARVK